MQENKAKTLMLIVKHMALSVTILLTLILTCNPAQALSDGNGIEYIRPSNKFGFGIRNPSNALTVNGSLALDNLSTAPDPTNGWGKIYVVGNDLYFKNNVGTSFLINNGSVSTVNGLDDLTDAKKGSTSIYIGHEATNDDGTNYNLAAGIDALINNTSGANNIALGYKAMEDNTSASENVAIGANALKDNTDRAGNVAIGVNSLAANDGQENTAVGADSMSFVTEGFYNTAIGHYALQRGSTINYNVAIGDTAMNNLTTGSRNVSIGVTSMASATSASNNIAIGHQALYTTTTASQNVAIGDEAIGGTTDAGEGNVAIGYQAGQNINGGQYNVLIGRSTASAAMTGSSNIIIGANNTVTNTSASNQLDIGDTIYADLSTDKVGIGQNTPAVGLHIGTGSPDEASLTGANDLYVSEDLEVDGTAYAVTFNGSFAGDATDLYNIPTPTIAIDDLTDAETSSNSVVLGSGASGASENNNTILGFNGLNSATTADGNVAVGSRALEDTTTADNNTAVGKFAMQNNINGGNNVAIGAQVMATSTGSSHNTTVGYDAMSQATAANENTIVGHSASYFNQTGANNVVIGKEAGEGSSGNSYSNNTFIGYKAAENVTTGSSNIVIGASNSLTTASGSNQLDIGDTIYADLSTDKVGIGQNTPTVGLHIGTGSPDEATVTDASDLYVSADIEADGTIYAPTINGGTLYGDATNLYNLPTPTSMAIDDLTDAATTATSIALGSGADGTSNTGNTAVGVDALSSTTSGTGNVAIGWNSLNAQTTGTDNVAIGVDALSTTTKANATVAIGNNTLKAFEPTDAALHRNVAVGSGVLEFATTGYNNTGLGTESLRRVTTGLNNTGLGHQALENVTTGDYNTAVGQDSLASATGNGNTAIGNDSGLIISTGQYNITIGHAGGDNITTGSENIIIGYDNDAPAANSYKMIDIADLYYGNGRLGFAGIGQAVPETGLHIGTGSPDEAGVDGAGDLYVSEDLEVDGTAYAVTFNGSFAGDATNLFNVPASTTMSINDLTDARISSSSVLMGNSFYNDDGSDNQNTSLGNGALANTTTGYENTAIGYQALNSNNTGFQNTSIGHQTLYTNSYGTNNIAIGNKALYSNLNGGSNIAIGRHSLYYNDRNGSENVAIGLQAAQGTSGYDDMDYSTIIGYQAAFSISDNADSNTVIGNRAAFNLTTGQGNFVAGRYAHQYNQTGNFNTALGYAAGQGTATNTGSDYNTFIGSNAGDAVDDDADNNTALGAGASGALTTGDNNITVGFQAGDNLTTGSSNIIIGYNIDASSDSVSNELNIGNSIYGDLSSDKIGIGQASPETGLHIGSGSPDEASVAQASDLYVSADIEADGTIYAPTINGGTLYGDATNLYNVPTPTISTNDLTDGKSGTSAGNPLYLGHQAGNADTGSSSSENTGIGYQALLNSTGDESTAVGYQALMSENLNGLNVAMGYRSLASNTNGYQNVAIGHESMENSSTGAFNTAVGASALDANNSGSSNVAIGFASSTDSIDGNNNVSVGTYSLNNHLSGDDNVAIGYNAGRGVLSPVENHENTFIGAETAIGLYSGNGNTALGYMSGNDIYDGEFNTLLGYQTGEKITSGDKNIIIGYQAGPVLTHGKRNILIGNGVAALTAGTNDHLNIGDTIYGNLAATRIGIGNDSPVHALDVVGTVNASIDLIASDDVFVGDKIHHKDETNDDTYISFVEDRIRVHVGNEILADFRESVQDFVMLGDGGNVDINLNDNMFVNGETGYVGINTTDTDAQLHVDGDLLVTESIVFESEIENTSNTTITVNWNNGNKQFVSLAHDNSTIQFNKLTSDRPASVSLTIIQNGGNMDVTTWSAVEANTDIKWPDGSAPDLSDGDNDIDVISCLYHLNTHTDNGEFLCTPNFNFE